MCSWSVVRRACSAFPCSTRSPGRSTGWRKRWRTASTGSRSSRSLSATATWCRSWARRSTVPWADCGRTGRGGYGCWRTQIDSVCRTGRHTAPKGRRPWPNWKSFSPATAEGKPARKGVFRGFPADGPPRGPDSGSPARSIAARSSCMPGAAHRPPCRAAVRRIRGSGWFVSLALMMACWMGVLGSIRGEALAGVIASHGSDGVTVRDADIGKIQEFLEKKIVLQKLTDYGVSAGEGVAKVRAMSDRDLHRLASLTDRTAEGADSALGFLIGLGILIILIIVIIKLMNKEVVIRCKLRGDAAWAPPCSRAAPFF